MGNWRSDLETWLAPFVAALVHKTRGRMCPAYIAGLIGPPSSAIESLKLGI